MFYICFTFIALLLVPLLTSLTIALFRSMEGTNMQDMQPIMEEARREEPEDLTSLEQLTADTITGALQKRWSYGNIYVS